MNPIDEKILMKIYKKENFDYDNLVPFSIIRRAFLYVDGLELLNDICHLADEEFLVRLDSPLKENGQSWYFLTEKGRQECHRIKFENSEARKNRRVQIISAVLSAVLGFLLAKFL